jgi:Rho GDP-dissociation inhibitor
LLTPSSLMYPSPLQFLDDDNKCYLEINYTFGIRKEWAAT